jgi:propanol-preferring alcohol dehydrogenase
MMREMRIQSTATGTRDEMKALLELAAEGKVRCKVETRKLDQINEVFDEMRAGRITGRVALKF